MTDKEEVLLALSGDARKWLDRRLEELPPGPGVIYVPRGLWRQLAWQGGKEMHIYRCDGPDNGNRWYYSVVRVMSE